MSQRARSSLTIGAVLIASMAGCAGTQRVDSTDPAVLPAPFELELQATGLDRRVVYYRVERDGTLWFAGGTRAAIREGRRITELTEAQLRDLWALVLDHRLLDAEGRLFAEPQRISYKVLVRAGSRRNSFSTIDDAVPGLDRVDAYLFEIQKQVSLEQVFKPIEDAIEASGGTIEKR